VRKGATDKRKVCLFVYYSGHGFQVNGMTAGKTTNSCDLDLDRNIRKLAIRANPFVIGVLDCCREIPDITKKGSEQIPDKIAGQFCLVHAVGPSKSAVVVRNSVLSEVTGEFLQVMKNAKLTFPACIHSWAKNHKTVELIDKCTCEIKFSKDATIPTALMTTRSSNLDEWSIEDVCSWFSSLHLTRDYSISLQENGIDGAALRSVIHEHVTWKEIGIAAMIGGDIAKIKRALKEQKIIV